jgi:hypothetical protein
VAWANGFREFIEALIYRELDAGWLAHERRRQHVPVVILMDVE